MQAQQRSCAMPAHSVSPPARLYFTAGTIKAACLIQTLAQGMLASLPNAIYPSSSPFPPGTIKATCLIETLPAAFEMHEFLYELRDHSAGVFRTFWFQLSNWGGCARSAFEMHEFLYELRDHSAGAFCTVWAPIGAH